jgi:hypothetical protein
VSVGMSILDYTTGLFRDPATLRAFVDDPREALREAGFPDATPEQVHDLFPVIAESMPADHPLQAVVHADDPAAALQALDVDEWIADAHDHHRDVHLIEKAVGGPETITVPQAQCAPSAPETSGPVVKVDTVDRRQVEDDVDKALGEAVDDPLTPEIEGPPPDDVPDLDDADGKAPDPLDPPDFDAVIWGKALE